MKTFAQYLTESEQEKVYEFVIKLANIGIDKGMKDRIKDALEAYSVQSISDPKSMPTQKDNDFPKMGSVECKVITVGLKYPTVSDQVLQVIASRAFLPAAQLCVRTKTEHEHWIADEARTVKRDSALLDDPDLITDQAGQDHVGQKKLASMFKDFESRKYEFAEKSKETGATLNDEPTGDVSPVGSKQTKRPALAKGKK